MYSGSDAPVSDFLCLRTAGASLMLQDLNSQSVQNISMLEFFSIIKILQDGDGFRSLLHRFSVNLQQLHKQHFMTVQSLVHSLVKCQITFVTNKETLVSKCLENCSSKYSYFQHLESVAFQYKRYIYLQLLHISGKECKEHDRT